MTKLAVTFTALSILTLLSVITAITFGPASINSSELIYCLVGSCDSTITNTVLWQVRIPRVLVALVAGMGLAIAGAILQNSTRNPLADPYLFGIVSGAGLGATIASIALADSLTVALPLAAFLGALFSILIVVFIAKILQRMEQLLLAGVAVSFMLAAITQFILYFGEPFATNRVIFLAYGKPSTGRDA
jgi:iron complex transport system permease protein